MHAGLLHVFVPSPSRAHVPSHLFEVTPAADVIELRLDRLPGADDRAGIASWIRCSPRPVLATVRSTSEGGAFGGPPEAAARLLAWAVAEGAEWIDVEDAVAPHMGTLPAGVRVVSSRHGKQAWCTSAPTSVGGRPVAVIKRASPLEDADDVAAVRRWLAASDGARRLFVPQGATAGYRTAFAGPGTLLYGAPRNASPVAEGQPALLDLLEAGRAGEVGPGAPLFGLVGRPSDRSPSPAIHNAAFRALGLPGCYAALPGLDVDAALAVGVSGLSITHPYKEAARQRADVADADAQAAGAANTLVRRADGALVAHLTDVFAVASSVPTAAPGAQALVYGTGGFARAAVVGLGRRGYAVRVTGRTPEAVDRLADVLGVEAAGDARRRAEDQVLVNATPLGADGRNVAPLADTPLDGLHVLDAPYRWKGPTGLALRAYEGATLVSGFELLVAQAREQVRHFTGSSVDPDVLSFAVDPGPPLVLLGGRGAGKTTVGRALARRLGRPFLDGDEEVLRVTGRSSAAWITGEGLRAFRGVEEQVGLRALAREGAVVAPGGGAVESRRVGAAWRTHARCVLLDVSPEVAAERVARDPGDRPPLVAGGPEAEAKALFARRDPVWRALAHHVVDAARDVEDIVEDVRRWWFADRRRPM